MKFTWFLIFFLQFNQILSTSKKKEENFVYGHRFKAVSCTADNITTLTKYCYVKAISRTVTTLNIGVKFLKVVQKPIYVRFRCFYRYGTINREVIDTKPQEWCGAMSGDKVHLFMKMTIDELQDAAPYLFHKCPYDESEIDIKNVTLNVDKTMAIFNAGIYTVNTTVAKDGKIIYQVTTVAEVKSPIRESFGRK